MTFLHPAIFFAGIAAIAIPILIHLLLRQRRRPIPWAAMRFLLEAYRKQRRKLRLQQFLLLAARCLLLALLAAALARPLLEGAGLLGATGKTLYLVIDTGLASQARLPAAPGARPPAQGASDNEPALARHQREARALLAALGPGDKAALFTLGAPAQALVSPPSADVAAVRALVDGLKPGDGATDLASGLELLGARIKSDQSASGATGSEIVVALLSDFLSGSADTSRPLPAALASLGGVRVLASQPAASGVGNVQITAVEPLRPVVLTGGASGGAGGGAGQREQVRVSLRRTGPSVGEAGVTSVRLRVAGGAGSSPSAPAQGAVRWEPGQAEATIALQIDPASARDGENAGAAGSVLLAEIDRDPLPGDNLFRRPVGIRESLRVGIIAQRQFGSAGAIDRMPPDQWLRLALRPAASAPVDVIDLDPAAIDGAALAGLDVVFAPAPDLIRDEDWPRLRRFADAGGLLVISPPQEASVHLWTDAMSRELGLGWRMAREPRSEPDGGASIDEASVTSGLLSLITPELAALARPVKVLKSLAPEQLSPATDVLIRLSGGTPWLIAAEPGAAQSDGEAAPAEGKPQIAPRAGRGLVMYLASAPALSWTDLPAKPLMVPLIQEIARQGFGRATGAWSAPAGRPIPVPARTALLRTVTSAGDGADEEPAPTVTPAALIASAARRAALFEAIDDAGRIRGLVAVNPDAEGGRTSPGDPTVIRAWLAGALGASAAAPGPDDPAGRAAAEAVAFLDEADPAAALGKQRAESPLSFPLLIAALAIALAELVMARWFSHAIAEPAARSGSIPGLGVAPPSTPAQGAAA